LLNAYYDCVIPAVEQAGGEVLKFMGDGILVVFEDSEERSIPAKAVMQHCAPSGTR